MSKLYSLILLAACAWPAWSQDVALELKGDFATIKVARVVTVYDDRNVAKSFPFEVKAPKGMAGYWWSIPPGCVAIDQGDTLKVTDAPKGEITFRAKWLVIDFDKKTATNAVGVATFFIGDAVPPVPPDPKPPIPPDPDPKPPQPVLSFRIIFVHESAKTLTAAQNSVISGKAVRDWLTANTTPEGAFAGWRHYDPQQTVANESPNMKRLWEAVQPKLSGIPCVVVEVNGRAEIIPLAATPAEMVATFDAYRKGGK